MITSSAHYGIQYVNNHSDPTDKLIEEITHNGYIIIDTCYSPQEIQNYRQKLDEIYKIQQDEVGGEHNLSLINDANVVRCLLAYDDLFLKLATHQTVLEICKKMLGPNYVLLMQNGVINQPNDLHYQTKWHRDLNYQHWVCSRPLALSALICIDRFSEMTGGTKVIPGSHLKENFPSTNYIERHTSTIEAPEGSILIMDSMLFHCAGKNTSDMPRRAVNHVIGSPILGQQISFPDMLNGKYIEDPFLEKFLGYTWKPKPNVRQWRLKRLDSLK